MGTGILGIQLLLWLQGTLFPEWYLLLPKSKNALMSFCGSVLQTGLWEEFIKSLPVLIYLYWPRKQVHPATALAVGMFSGLGFAAFENVHYALKPAIGIANFTEQFGALSVEAQDWVRADARQALLQQVSQAQIGVLMRSLSAVFGHAVLSGIVAFQRSASPACLALLFVTTLGTFSTDARYGLYVNRPRQVDLLSISKRSFSGDHWGMPPLESLSPGSDGGEKSRKMSKTSSPVAGRRATVWQTRISQRPVDRNICDCIGLSGLRKSNFNSPGPHGPGNGCIGLLDLDPSGKSPNHERSGHCQLRPSAVPGFHRWR